MNEHFNWLSGFVLPYLNFFIFLSILVFFAKAPVKEMIRKKRTSFENLLSQANNAKEEAIKKTTELDLKLSKLDLLFEEKSKAIVLEAQVEADKIVAEGKRQAEVLKEDAMRLVREEASKLKASLQNEILAEAKSALLSKIKEELSAENKDFFVNKQIKELSRLASLS
jgi:F-type H+-transporting ATPase subunit b